MQASTLASGSLPAGSGRWGGQHRRQHWWPSPRGLVSLGACVGLGRRAAPHLYYSTLGSVREGFLGGFSLISSSARHSLPHWDLTVDWTLRVGSWSPQRLRFQVLHTTGMSSVYFKGLLTGVEIYGSVLLPSRNSLYSFLTTHSVTNSFFWNRHPHPWGLLFLVNLHQTWAHPRPEVLVS